MRLEHKTFAIVGAGLLGRLLAWRLLEAGQTVTLFDQNLDGKQSAGIVAAAMIAPVSEVLDGEFALYTQGKKSIDLWHNWLQDLNAHLSTPIDFSFKGSVIVAHKQDKPLYQRLLKKMHDHPLIAKTDYRPLNSEALQATTPSLGHFTEGCFLPNEGYLDNQALFAALLSRIQQLGGECIQARLPDTKAELLKHPQLKYAQTLIDCRGFGARKTLPQLRGVRGEVLRVRAKEVNFQHAVRLMHPRYKLYVVPRPNHEYIIGATQIESASEAPVTVRSSLELLSALYSLHTGFAEAEILQMDARCRPAFDDHLPAIIQDKDYLAINGLHRHGYLLAPPVVEQTLATLGLPSNASISNSSPPNTLPHKGIWPDIVKDSTNEWMDIC